MNDPILAAAKAAGLATFGADAPSGVWPSAYSTFPGILGGEGIGITWMYLDRKGLVTTGSGNLVDASPSSTPWSPAVNLQGSWVNADGSAASADDIQSAWQTVKDSSTSNTSAYSDTVKGLTSIRLSKAGLDNLIHNHMNSDINILIQRAPGFPQWPADGQMALMRWAWGVGASAVYPKMFSYLNSSPPDFASAANESDFTPENADTRAQIRQLFANADSVQKAGGDPSEVVYPSSANTPPTAVASNTPSIVSKVASWFKPSTVSTANGLSFPSDNDPSADDTPPLASSLTGPAIAADPTFPSAIAPTPVAAESVGGGIALLAIATLAYGIYKSSKR